MHGRKPFFSCSCYCCHCESYKHEAYHRCSTRVALHNIRCFEHINKLNLKPMYLPTTLYRGARFQKAEKNTIINDKTHCSSCIQQLNISVIDNTRLRDSETCLIISIDSTRPPFVLLKDSKIVLIEWMYKDQQIINSYVFFFFFLCQLALQMLILVQ